MVEPFCFFMNSDRISKTAAFIAIKFYGLTLSPPFRSLFDPGIVRFYEQIVRTLPPPLNTCHSLLERKWIRCISTFFEEFLLPGDLLHILIRKYGIGKAVEHALSEDFKQMVILGAGFDHLGAIYSRQGIRCIEIDRPSMADFKRHFVKRFDYGNPFLFVEDLMITRTSLRRLLSEKNDLDPNRNTIIVAEGFFDYISPLETAAVLEVVGEKIRLGLSKTGFEELLEQNGFPIFSTVPSPVLPVAKHRLDDHGLDILNGFYLVQAYRDKKK